MSSVFSLHLKHYNKFYKLTQEKGYLAALTLLVAFIIKKFASVVIYLDNGHVSKIRSGVSKTYNKRPRPTKARR